MRKAKPWQPKRAPSQQPPIAARGQQVRDSGLSSSGYWLVESNGGIFAFGDAHFYGSTGGITLANPIVGMAATPDGKGYWLVPPTAGSSPSATPTSTARPAAYTGQANRRHGRHSRREGLLAGASNGGIFAFGDAHFHGSTGGITLAKPDRRHGCHPRREGLLAGASDGGIFAFGDAHFDGSTGGMTLGQANRRHGRHSRREGLLVGASNGGIFAFGEPTSTALPPA